MGDESSADRTPRALPDWAWGLAVICHPAGIFIALATARAIRWSNAVILAIVSWAISAVFVYGMIWAESLPKDTAWMSKLVLLGLGTYYLAVGYFQYRLGLRARLWTERATRVWRAVVCLAVLCVILIVAGMVLNMLID